MLQPQVSNCTFSRHCPKKLAMCICHGIAGTSIAPQRLRCAEYSGDAAQALCVVQVEPQKASRYIFLATELGHLENVRKTMFYIMMFKQGLGQLLVAFIALVAACTYGT